jgi:hypothetical protein
MSSRHKTENILEVPTLACMMAASNCTGVLHSLQSNIDIAKHVADRIAKTIPVGP